MHWLRSILAILIGFIVDLGLILLCFSFIESDNPAVHQHASGQLLLIAIAALAGVISGFVAASIAAPPRRLVPPIVLGILLALVAVLMTLNDLEDTNSPVAKEPLWFIWALPVLALPTVLLGAWLRLLIWRHTPHAAIDAPQPPLQLPDQSRPDEPARQ